MNILVISDLHIDPDDAFGTFQWDADSLICHIEKIKNEHDIEQIILNGDIFELYKYRYKEIAETQKKLIDYLNKPCFVHVKGNHDITRTQVLNHYMLRNSLGQTIYIEHGHKADFLNGTKIGRFISKYLLCFLKKMMHNKLIHSLYFKLVEYYDEIDRIPKKYNTYKYLKYALAKLKEYDVVILGHTHKLETHHTYYLNKKKRYLNCGTCSLGRFQGIVLDTETLRYTLINTDKKEIKKVRKTPMFAVSILHTA